MEYAHRHIWVFSNLESRYKILCDLMANAHRLASNSYMYVNNELEPYNIRYGEARMTYCTEGDDII